MFGKDVAYIHRLPRGISEGRGEASGTSCGIILVYRLPLISHSFTKKMGEFGGQNAHSTLNTDCESGV